MCTWFLNSSHREITLLLYLGVNLNHGLEVCVDLVKCFGQR